LFVLHSGSNAVSAVYITACSEASAVKKIKIIKIKNGEGKQILFLRLHLKKSMQ